MRYLWQQQRLIKIITLSILWGLCLNRPVYGRNQPQATVAQLDPSHSLTIAHNLDEEAEDVSDRENERIIFLSGKITYETADAIVSKLLRLDAENPDEDIYIYISSPGGSVYAGMAIYDAMQYVQADVVTISVGFSGSMAAFLLAAGTPGKRFAFPHARVMIHKPFGGAFGEAGDLEIRARESRHNTNQFYRLLALHTGQSIRQIQRDTERDYYMSATEAVEYGIIDQIMERDRPVAE